MNFIRNQLIRWLHENRQPTVERILFIDATRTKVSTIVVESEYEAEVRTALPVWREYKDIVIALETLKAVLLETDHCAPPLFSEGELNSKKHENSRKHRDAALDRIGPLVEGQNAIDMLSTHERTRLIASRVKETGFSRQTLFTDLRRWWQGGQTPNTLLGRFFNCGIRKDRQPRNVQQKLGRPSCITLLDASKRATGVNVDDRWRQIIELGGQLFYENHKQVTWETAYTETLAHFCPKGYREENGIKKPILPDPLQNEAFTLEQFKYHYRLFMNRNLRRSILKRVGTRAFNLRHREKTGNAKNQGPGPTAIYQIDATLADIYLVSRLNRRKIVGRPVIYAVVDVFSHMIVGICVRLEGEGWQGVRLALENAVTDKVSFCAEYGIEITEETWPAHYLCEHLTGDRGPLESKNGDNIPRSLNIRLSNTAPYRADWKGLIEQIFRLLNIRVIHALPGAVEPKHERGDGDYRLDAVLDIYQFTRIVIKTVLLHNLQCRIENFSFDADMIEDEVEPYPVDIFTWGIENRSGSPREIDRELVMINLLPEAEATVTEYGLKFGPAFYTCDMIEKEGWRFKAGNTKTWRERVAFHPRRADIIYLRPGGGRPAIPCHLIDPHSPFAGCDWAEIDAHNSSEKVASSVAKVRRRQDNSDFWSDINNDVAEATKMTNEAHAGAPKESKRRRVRGIKDNRKEEIESIHLTENRQPLPGELPKSQRRSGPSSDIPAPGDPDEEMVPIPEVPTSKK